MPSLRSLARASAFGIVALAGSSFRAQAVPMTGVQVEGPRHTYTYSTLATFADGSVMGIPSISFQGVQGQTVESAAPFVLGSYPRGVPAGSVADFPLGKLVVALPSEGSTVYDFAEFGIMVRVEAVDGMKLASPITTLLRGMLKGVINSVGESNLSYGIGGQTTGTTFDPPGYTAGVFKHDGLRHSIIDLSIMTIEGVRFSSDTEFALDAKLMSAVPVNTPEPGTWAVFALAAGIGVYRKRGGKPRAA
jgi:hypothetical protein